MQLYVCGSKTFIKNWQSIQNHPLKFCANMIFVIYYAKQKQPGCKKVRGQSEATMAISDQNL